MSGLEPTGPSQPTLNQAYTTPGNPATKEPVEEAQTNANASDTSKAVDKRIPNEQVAPGTEGQAKAPGGGIHVSEEEINAPAGSECQVVIEKDFSSPPA
jgi:hypothetical protein